MPAYTPTTLDITHSKNFIRLGFRDYLSARTLLRASHLITGMSLASSAVEKYLKAIVVLYGMKVKKVHLNDPADLKGKLTSLGLDLHAFVEPDFFDLLGTVYTLRYYPTKTRHLVFVHQWQALCCLDESIFKLDKALLFQEDGRPVESMLRCMRRENNACVVEDNFLGSNGDLPAKVSEKKVMMEREGSAAAIIIETNKREIFQQEFSIRAVSYTGKILRMTTWRTQDQTLILDYNEPTASRNRSPGLTSMVIWDAKVL